MTSPGSFCDLQVNGHLNEGIPSCENRIEKHILIGDDLLIEHPKLSQSVFYQESMT
jgi:hypothetical protein